MIARFLALFRRYADQHARVRLRKRRLPRLGDGKALDGYVDEIEVDKYALRIGGWSRGDQVGARVGSQGRWVTPGKFRPDLGQPGDENPQIGFELEMPWHGAPVSVAHRLGDKTASIRLRELRAAYALARVRLLPGFLWRVIWSVPDAFSYARTGDFLRRTAVKRKLGLEFVQTAGCLRSDVLDLPAPPVPDMAVDIVLPVYNAFDVLREALERVEAHTDVPWHLTIVEDRSPDPAIWPYLQAWAEARPDRVTLLRPEANGGFLASVNLALDRIGRPRRPVVLLNSDALVPPGWATRLLAPFAEDPDIASVTPMSNDAEIFSAPQICVPTALGAGEGDRLDEAARAFAGHWVPAPTGVGFCMAMNPRFLALVPRFDPAFGRGYGEEVDWCRRVQQEGGVHVGHAGVFVEHRGGQSFGSEEKWDTIRKHNAIISARYPGYDAEVQDFVRLDPLLTPRLALALTLLGARAAGPVPVYVAHSLGGGAEHDLQRRITENLAACSGAVVVRTGGVMRWQVEVVTADGIVAGRTEDGDLVLRLLRQLGPRRIIYSNSVGDSEPGQIPEFLVRMALEAEAFEVLFHDFFPISPSYCLLDHDQIYRGPVTATRTDPQHVWRARGTQISLRDWQARWGEALALATNVTVFSHSSAEIVAAAYPSVRDRIVVKPHPHRHGLTPVATVPHRPPVIAALGNINAQKGLEVLRALASRTQTFGDARLVVIGKTDPTRPLPRSVTVHGQYKVSDIPALIERYGITHWIIPSIWPETFSFTTREALATGLPVLAFDIGAQGEAVRAAPNGVAVPLDPDIGAAPSMLTALQDAVRAPDAVAAC
jgi:GT2 family glycosyltransferase/glycosyltransferase involved in cell wall biosynthesis